MKADGKSKNYKRATLRNLQTGEREEIALFDTTNEENNSDILAIDTSLELHADLKKALSKFNRLQQRILFRILVQGQSVELATKASKKSRRWWAAWLQNEAIPQLRTALADYFVDGKVVLS